MKKMIAIIALSLGLATPTIKPAAKDITTSILKLITEGEDAANAITANIRAVKAEKELIPKITAVKTLLDNLDTIAEPTVVLLTALANIKLLKKLYKDMPKIVTPLQKLQQGLAEASTALEDLGL